MYHENSHAWEEYIGTNYTQTKTQIDTQEDTQTNTQTDTKTDTQADRHSRHPQTYKQTQRYTPDRRTDSSCLTWTVRSAVHPIVRQSRWPLSIATGQLLDISRWSPLAPLCPRRRVVVLWPGRDGQRVATVWKVKRDFFQGGSHLWSGVVWRCLVVGMVATVVSRCNRCSGSP